MNRFPLVAAIAFLAVGCETVVIKPPVSDPVAAPRGGGNAETSAPKAEAGSTASTNPVAAPKRAAWCDSSSGPCGDTPADETTRRRAEEIDRAISGTQIAACARDQACVAWGPPDSQGTCLKDFKSITCVCNPEACPQGIIVCTSSGFCPPHEVGSGSANYGRCEIVTPHGVGICRYE